MTVKKAAATTKKAAETAVASDPVKTEAPVKAEKPAEKTVDKKVEAKAEAAAKTEKPAKAEPAKKTAAKKEPAKKTAAKKTVKAEKSAVTQNIYVQFAGNEFLTSDLVAKVTENWVALGHRASSIKSLDLYVKPEDMAAYYVINGKESGKIAL